MTSKFSIDNRELLQRISSGEAVAGIDFGNLIVRELAAFRLAAMGSRPHTGDELSNLLWYSQEATCHSDPNYYCEFQRLATPGLIAGIIRELQERRKADSEPVAWTWQHLKQWHVTNDEERVRDLAWDGVKVEPLYRHAQPASVTPVCTCPSGDGSLRWPCPVHPGNSPVIPDGWTCNDKANAALMMLDRIETADPVDDDRIDGIKRIVRELAAAPQSPGSEHATVPGKWIPVSERMPEKGQAVLVYRPKAHEGGDSDVRVAVYGRHNFEHGFGCYWEPSHWMPLPAAPQEVKP